MTPVPLLALLVLLTPGSPTQALAWADRLYAKIAPLPKADPRFELPKVLDAYRQVAKSYPSQRANEGIGNCLMLYGHYNEAATAYGNSPKATEACLRAEVAKACAKFAHRRTVVQVERVPRTEDRWVAFFAKVYVPRRGVWEGGPYASTSQLGLRQFRFKHARASAIGKEMAISKGKGYEEPARASLYVCDGRVGREPFALVYDSFPGGDNSPNRQTLARIERFGLQKEITFLGKDWASVFAANRDRGLHLMVTPTWKVWWPDTYEWNGHRFVFASQRFPELYPPSNYTPTKNDKDDFENWMTYAAELTIRGERRGAIRAWKDAEATCKLAIEESNGQYFGFYGDLRENLKEIRQRLRWLRKGDLNHPLLYRPYDFDLQVPPYRLGHARD